MKKTATTITVQSESKVKATGEHFNGNAKPVFCITTGEVFASVTDAAKAVGSSQNNLSAHLAGITSHCKGKRFCFISKVTEHLDEIAIEFRTRSEKVAAYDKILAEQEAIRKANEELARRKEEIAKHKENIKKLRAQLEKETASMQEAEAQLNALTETNNAA